MAYPDTFKCAGVSRYKGEVKVRFANDLTRVKVYLKAGQPEVELIELPEEMSRVDAAKFLLTSELMQNQEYAEAIQETNDKYAREAATLAKRAAKSVEVKAEKGAKPKAAKATKTKAAVKPSLDAIKARAKKEKAVPAAEAAE